MPRTREHSEPTRQIYASIREDIYLAAKTRAAELRVPMRRFIEDALSMAISPDMTASGAPSVGASSSPPSVWDDQYIEAQARQPLGAPLDLSEEEARQVALGAFGGGLSAANPPQEAPAPGDLGDPLDVSDEDAAKIARESLMFGAFGRSE